MQETPTVSWVDYVGDKSGAGISLVAALLVLSGGVLLVGPSWQPSSRLLLFRSLFVLGLPAILLIGGILLRWRDLPDVVGLWAFTGYLGALLFAAMVTAGALPIAQTTVQTAHPWSKVEVVLRNANVGGLFGFVSGAAYGQLIHTRRIRAELERKTDALERQRDSLELLNDVVRHDIRNDLQLVTAYAELLEDHVDEDGKAHLETVQKSSSNAVDLTTTARDLADVMLQSERELQPVDVGSVLAEEVEEARTSFPDADISVEGSVPQVVVEADEFAESVFKNLLTNAVQHNDDDHPEVTVSVEQTGDHLEVRFADNGPGVPDLQKADIFGRDEKGLESEGTGIGLYLVRSLMDAYSGDVWVEDNDPIGAVFVVRFPIAR